MKQFGTMFDPFPRPSQLQLDIERLSEEYHERTETYDRTVCTGPIRYGAIIPSNDLEYRSCASNARNVLKEIVERAGILGINSVQMRVAISNWRKRWVRKNPGVTRG